MSYRSAQGESFSDEEKQASTAGSSLFAQKWSPEREEAQHVQTMMENKLV